MRFAMILLPFAFLLGCQRDPHANLYTTEMPRLEDVAGRYTLTSQALTKDGLSVLQGRECVLELRADNSFAASNFPPMGAGGTNFFSMLVSTSGTWRIDGVGQVGPDSKTVWGVRMSPNLMPAGLTGAKSPYGLIVILGDPDSGHSMILERAR